MNYSLEVTFWIDTDGYSDRDREMFVCGAEFVELYLKVKAGGTWDQCIHNENASRVRMLCGRLGWKCQLTAFDDTWTQCVVSLT